jgi:hypothetical protein
LFEAERGREREREREREKVCTQMLTTLTTILTRGKTECIQTTTQDNRNYQQATAFNVPINIFFIGTYASLGVKSQYGLRGYTDADM